MIQKRGREVKEIRINEKRTNERPGCEKCPRALWMKAFRGNGDAGKGGRGGGAGGAE